MSDSVDGRRIARNSLLTFGTAALLLVGTVIFVPLMLDTYGRDLYGVLSLTWVLLAQLAWLDLGLSRATAKYVAQDLALGRRDDAAEWSLTALLTQTLLGAAGAVAVWFAAPAIADAFHVRPANHGVAVLAFRLFGIAVPLELASRSLVGTLQAAQRFVWTNAMQALSSLLMYGVFLGGILSGGHFKAVVVALFLLRFVYVGGLFAGAARTVPLLEAARRVRLLSPAYRARIREMFAFGLWITVASTLGPLLIYFDQWTISYYLGVAALPFYAVPFAMLQRMMIFPLSMTQTLFPAFSALDARNERARVEGFFLRANRFLLVTITPLLFVVFVWAHEILRLWISENFASHAATPLRILAAASVVALLAPLSGALLEGLGRPDVVAKVYLVELPINLVAVVLLVREFGLVGAAASFAVRSVIETGVLWLVISKVVSFARDSRALVARTAKQFTATIAVLAAIALLVGSARLGDDRAIGASLALLVAYLPIALLLMLDGSDRRLLKSIIDRTSP
jgi:O-antigen/teichoic acid export membrane protein